MPSAVAPWPNMCHVSSTEGSPELGRGSTHLLPNGDNLSQERYRLLGRHLQWPENKKNVFQRSGCQNDTKLICWEVIWTLRRTLLHNRLSQLNPHHDTNRKQRGDSIKSHRRLQQPNKSMCG